jgi:integrase
MSSDSTLSNPVAPTILTVLDTPPDGAKPVDYPVDSQAALVAQGLAEIGHALIKIAAALSGGKTAPAGERVSHFSTFGGNVLVTPRPVTPPGASRIEPLTVREVVNEFIIAKSKANRSDRYLRQLRVVFSSFSRGRSATPLHEITPQEIERWIYGLKARPKTMRNYLADVKTLFNFAVRRQYAAHNPAHGVDLPASDSRGVAPGIHTPEQVRTVLEAVRASNLDACRLLAIRYFAGVRSAEGHRLREENILLDRGVIEVPAVKAKTRSRRLVPITPNLRAWLALGGELRPLGEMTLRAMIQASGVDWPHNCTRHSFISYHVAAHEKPNRTAMQAGTSEALIFSNYRAVVTAEAAKEFFAIVPK